MTLPFALPAWMPWWLPILVIVPVLLYALVFLLMPFNVFGVKPRLDAMEMRLDEIQGEIRALVLRLPEAGRRREDELAELVMPRPLERPPIPPEPPRAEPSDAEMRARISGSARSRPAPARDDRPTRAEPKLNWPR